MLLSDRTYMVRSSRGRYETGYGNSAEKGISIVFNLRCRSGISSSKAFHDRFIILDGKTVYHVGASIKDAAKKCFGISQWKDQGSINDLLSRVK